MTKQSKAEAEDDPEDRSKPPREYGTVLQSHREALGLTQEAFAKLLDVTLGTISRNESGSDRRSMKAMVMMRDKLVELGRDVPPPIPAGAEIGHAASTSKLSPMGDRIRRNLIRFRERLDLDQPGAAYVTGVGLLHWQAFESGDEEPSGTQLIQIAKAFGTDAGAFDLDGTSPLPPLKLSPEQGGVMPFYRLVSDHLTQEERMQIEQISLAARARAKGAAEAERLPPKRK